MADKPKTELDFENMSDEDFLKLDEADFSGNLPEGETDFSNAAPEEEIADEDPNSAETDQNETVDDNNSGDSTESNESNDDSVSDSDSGEEANADQTGSADPHAGEGQQVEAEKDSSVQQQSGTDSTEEGADSSETDGGSGTDVNKQSGSDKTPSGKEETPAKAGYYKLPDGMSNEQVTSAIGFYEQISKPFKADGKEFTVRSPEDAIRLMQQGLNYSKRMEQLKPMKHLNRTLQDNGLADQNKLNFAIDLMKGNKDAIVKLLKDHNIDPVDLDPENQSGYQATNYGGSSQDNAFRDALDVAMETAEGQSLVSHIHKDWDDASKAKIRSDPGILGNLNRMKQAGLYDKVVEELDYQRSMGYLVGVPFLEAFDQVGEAMNKAGVFNQPIPESQGNTSMGELSAQPQAQPIASGGRKPQGQKKPEANPHLSSTPPSKQSGNQKPAPVDFDTLSDEEFLKMPPPT